MPDEAEPLLFWDFENVLCLGAVSTSVARSTHPDIITSFVTQTGGGPAESWGGVGLVFLTRFLGTHEMWLYVHSSKNIRLEALRFQHWHNHNPGFPSCPQYSIQLQIDRGGGWKKLGKPLIVSGENHRQVSTIDIGKPMFGGFRIRFQPEGLAFGKDTNTEFFAIKHLEVVGTIGSRSAASKRKKREG